MPFLVELVAPPAPLLAAAPLFAPAPLLAGAPLLAAVLLVVAAPDEPEDPAAELAEFDEFEPQAATARATSASASGASRRIDVRVCDFIRFAPSHPGLLEPHSRTDVASPLDLLSTRSESCCSLR
jgi:hypothetical protein